MKKKDDYFESGKPVHRTSFCTFLDVLGFSDRIRESFKSKKGDALLQRFHSTLSERIAELRGSTVGTMLYFKSFTDNIIVAHPRFSDDLESEFGFTLWSIAQLQLAMALEGFFIRGGMSVGPLFMDEDSVYGPALLEAHDLESKIAINPITACSNDVMALILKHMKYYARPEESPQNKAVLVNADGRFFINYLAECIYDGGEFYEVDGTALRRHKERVEEALSTYRTVPSVFAKYAWLAAYHNHFCDSVGTYPGYSDDMKVAAASTALTFSEASSLMGQT